MKLHRRKVKQLLKDRGVSTFDFSKMMGLSYDSFINYMEGRNVPQTVLQDMADYFDVPLLELAKFEGFDY